MNKLIKKLKLNTKMGSDIFWNMVSMAFVAASGLIYNSIFVLLYDPSVFGIFSQANVFYAMMSQITVFGIHFSVLKYTSQYADEREQRDKMISSAIIGTLVISVVLSSIFFGINYFLNTLGDDFHVLKMLYCAIPALVFFSLNKVLLNFLNGIRKMKPYALFNALRYVFIIAVLLFLGLNKAKANSLMLVYLFGEMALFIFMGIYILIAKLITFKVDYDWIKEHVFFGSKIFLGNLVVELNTKVDILVLGIFASNYVVGLYQFAVTFAEGFYMILVVIRNNINPLITKYYYENKEEFGTLRKKVSKMSYRFIPPLGILVVGGYYALCFILGKAEFAVSVTPLACIILFHVVCSYFIILGNTMNQTGHPKSQTVLNLATVFTNIVLNLILIPKYGMIGAGIATGLSFVSFSIILNIQVKNKLDIKLI